MPCAESLATQALIDGELSGPQAEAARAHLAACPECQALAAGQQSLTGAIRAAASRHHAPMALRERIGRALDAEARRLDTLHQPAGAATRRSFWRGALAGAAGMGLAAAAAAFLTLPPTAETLADALVNAHVRALMAGRPIEVASSDHHTVKPWFAGRVPLSPPVADFAAQGFPLAGGRADRVADAQAAVVVYRHGGHWIDLFVWADRGGALPAAGLRHGWRARFWKAGDLDFAAVSDVQAGELDAFCALVRAQRE